MAKRKLGALWAYKAIEKHEVISKVKPVCTGHHIGQCTGPSSVFFLFVGNGKKFYLSLKFRESSQKSKLVDCRRVYFGKLLKKFWSFSQNTEPQSVDMLQVYIICCYRNFSISTENLNKRVRLLTVVDLF